MAGYEKDTIYYRVDIDYGYCNTSGYLGENCPDGARLLREIKDFLQDEDAKTIEIVRHEAKAGDHLAHVAGIELKLIRKDGHIMICE